MLNLGDVDFIKDSIEETEDYTGEEVTLKVLSSSTGTASSLTPRTMVYGTESAVATVRRINARELNESGGIYQADDLVCCSSGSFSQEAQIIYRSGTYDVIEKQQPTTIDGEDVRFRTVLRHKP